MKKSLLLASIFLYPFISIASEWKTYEIKGLRYHTIINETTFGDGIAVLSMVKPKGAKDNSYFVSRVWEDKVQAQKLVHKTTDNLLMGFAEMYNLNGKILILTHQYGSKGYSLKLLTMNQTLDQIETELILLEKNSLPKRVERPSIQRAMTLQKDKLAFVYKHPSEIKRNIEEQEFKASYFVFDKDLKNIVNAEIELPKVRDISLENLALDESGTGYLVANCSERITPKETVKERRLLIIKEDHVIYDEPIEILAGKSASFTTYCRGSKFICQGLHHIPSSGKPGKQYHFIYSIDKNSLNIIDEKSEEAFLNLVPIFDESYTPIGENKNLTASDRYIWHIIKTKVTPDGLIYLFERRNNFSGTADEIVVIYVSDSGKQIWKNIITRDQNTPYQDVVGCEVYIKEDVQDLFILFNDRHSRRDYIALTNKVFWANGKKDECVTMTKINAQGKMVRESIKNLVNSSEYLIPRRHTHYVYDEPYLDSKEPNGFFYKTSDGRVFFMYLSE